VESRRVFVANRTVALCDAARAPQMPCIRPEEIETLGGTASVADRRAFGSLLDDAPRTALPGSFTKRNEESGELPTWDRPDVVLLDAAGLRRESQRLSSPGASGFAGFSHPAYLPGGQAVVYVFYLCGNVCGYGWFVLLQRGEKGWQVQATHPLWVS
jgi:hypothetical protein